MPRPTFTLELLVEGEPEQVWDRLWDLDRHTAAVPLTDVRGAGSEPLHEGARFTARTGLGPVGVDDDMVVRLWEPPRHAVIEKVGRVLGGSLEVTLAPVRDQPARTLLRWRQSYSVTRLPDRLTGLARPAVRTAYRIALRRITAP